MSLHDCVASEIRMQDAVSKDSLKVEVSLQLLKTKQLYELIPED